MELSFQTDNAPKWFLQRIVPEKVHAVAARYASIVEHLDGVLRLGGAKEKAVIRLLALHHWRKMALRDNTWCHIGLFPNGAFARSQSIVSGFLNEPPIAPPNQG